MKIRMATFGLALAAVAAWSGATTPVAAQDAEQNRAMFTVIVNQVFNGGNLALVDDLVAKDVTGDGAALGRNGFKTLVQDLRTKSPAYRLQIDDMATDGDKVVGRVTENGSAGVTSHLMVLRIADGQVKEYWSLADEPALRRWHDERLAVQVARRGDRFATKSCARTMRRTRSALTVVTFGLLVAACSRYVSGGWDRSSGEGGRAVAIRPKQGRRLRARGPCAAGE
jgi:predicted ester cyclase